MVEEIKVKPIIQETGLSKTVKEVLFKDLPINKWCMERDAKRRSQPW